MLSQRKKKEDITLFEGETYYVVGDAIEYESADRVAFEKLIDSFPKFDHQSSIQFIKIFPKKEDAEFYAAHPPKDQKVFALFASKKKYKTTAAIFEFTLLEQQELLLKHNKRCKSEIMGVGKCRSYHITREELLELNLQPEQAKVSFCGKERRAGDCFFEDESSCCCLPM